VFGFSGDAAFAAIGFVLQNKLFYATDDCTSCGLCEKLCNTGNIIVDKKPSWGSNCTGCLACIHCCPQRAVQYGKSTIKKGRYKNPNVAFDINSK
jgi:MinD superfamily P-loop ATPase